MVTGPKCPVCNNTNSSCTGTHLEYRLYQCPHCDLSFCDPLKIDFEYYQDNFDYIMRDTVLADPLEQQERWDIDQALKKLEQHSGSLLDVGCGTGFFVKRAYDMGYEAYGIETDERAVKKGRDLFKLEHLYPVDSEGFVSQVGKGLKFDFVTMFQVLEHLDDLNLSINCVKETLKSGGTLLLSLPYRDRFPDTLYDADLPPHHLTRWSRKSMEYFLQDKHGFNVREIAIEDFPLESTIGIAYHFTKKFMPALTASGKHDGDSLRNISQEDAASLLRMRNFKLGIAKAAMLPAWLLFKMLGSRGPHMFISAELP